MHFIKTNTLIILCLANTIRSVLILKVKDVNHLRSLVNTIANTDYELDYKDNVQKRHNKKYLVEDNYDFNYEGKDKEYLKEPERIEAKKENFKGFKKTLVKRIIPAGYQTSELEYDRKHNMYFRPLIKMHVPRETLNRNKIFGDVDKRSKYVKDTLTNFIQNVVNKVDALPPVNMIPSEELGKHERFKGFLEQVANRMEKKLRKKRLLRINPSKKLGSSTFQKSGEVNYPPYSSNVPPHLRMDKSVEKQRYPKYNFWDFWTYEKTIYQDKCKGSLLNWNGICIETPPH